MYDSDESIFFWAQASTDDEVCNGPKNRVYKNNMPNPNSM